MVNFLLVYRFGTDGSQPYPFSVKVDKPLTLSDVFRINRCLYHLLPPQPTHSLPLHVRDQYEGTPFDLTSGLDAGPYGDPMRFPPMTKWRDPVQGVTWEAYLAGGQNPSVLLSLLSWPSSAAPLQDSASSAPSRCGAPPIRASRSPEAVCRTPSGP